MTFVTDFLDNPNTKATTTPALTTTPASNPTPAPTGTARIHRSARGRSRVLLDTAWAHHLGVARTGGAYLIDRRSLAGLLGPAGSESMAQEWDIDPAHTNVSFIARHLMLAKVRGGFREFSGTFRVGAVPEESSVEIEIQAASIDTGLALRDAHLRSADFLDVDNHPHLRFRSTGLVRRTDRSYRLAGELTIKGVTNPVELELDYLGAARDAAGRMKVAFEARAQIDREDFGLTWNRILEGGGYLVDRMVNLEIQAQALPRISAA